MNKQQKQVFRNYIPTNARIKVSYGGKGEKPKAKFSFPIKPTEKKIHGIVYIGLFFLIVAGLFLYLFLTLLYAFLYVIVTLVFHPVYISVFLHSLLSPPASNNYTFTFTCQYNSTYCQAIFSNSTIHNQVNLVKNNPNSNLTTKVYDYLYPSQSQSSLLPIASIVLMLLIPELLYQLIKDKPIWITRLTGWTPKFFALINSPTSNYIMINQSSLIGNAAYVYHLRNVELTYKASGDFAKYLKEVQILEFPTNYIKLYKGGKKKPTIMKDEFNWVAKFTFSKRPKTGSILVNYI